MVARAILLCGRTLSLYIVQPFLLLILRSLVRSRTFWEKGLSSAWFNKSKVTSETVDAYRKAQIVKDWDKGLVKFVFAMIFGMQGDQVLADVIAAAKDPIHPLKVLIIHGQNDRIVPLSNSLKLAEQIPNCTLQVVPECGHVPQEELPQAFMDIAINFLERCKL